MSQSRRHANHGSLLAYIYGYSLSLYLTLTAYLLVTHRLFNAHTLVYAVLGLALTQFIVQVFFFLHIGNEERPRWKLLAFLFMIMVVIIVVVGSLWIMANLDYHHPASSTQVNQYMRDQDAL